MRQIEYGEIITPPSGYEGRTWYDKSDPEKKVIDFANYPIIKDTTFVLHNIYEDDVYILNPLGEMNITLGKDEAIVTTCLFISTKNGEYYNNVQMSFLQECDWIRNIDMIEDSANNTIGFQFVVDELPQEIYENGRSVTAIITQLDTGGVSREFEIVQEMNETVEDVYVFIYQGDNPIIIPSRDTTTITLPFISSKNGVQYRNLSMTKTSGGEWLNNFRITDEGGTSVSVELDVDVMTEEDEREAIIQIKQEEGNSTPYQITIRQISEIDGYCQPITENTTGETTFNLRETYVDTSGNIMVNKIGSDTPYTVGAAGPLCFFVYFEKNNTGGITFEGSRTECSLIDDYGAFLMRKVNTWTGGSSQTASTTLFTFKTVNEPTVTRKRGTVANIDEDNTLLLRNYMSTKAIRTPFSGLEGSIYATKFPYNFHSNLFFDDLKITYVSDFDSATTTNIEGISFEADGISFEITNYGNTNLDANCHYNISPNDTCDYKHYVILLTGGNYVSLPSYISRNDCVMLHFVQEYNVKNRIYYGNTWDADFDDRYYETRNIQYIYHSFFETCTSKILTQDTETFSIANTTLFAYPNYEEFEYEFDTSTGNYTVLNDNYMWGSQSYTVCMLISATNFNINFRKKV